MYSDPFSELKINCVAAALRAWIIKAISNKVIFTVSCQSVRSVRNHNALL